MGWQPPKMCELKDFGPCNARACGQQSPSVGFLGALSLVLSLDEQRTEERFSVPSSTKSKNRKNEAFFTVSEVFLKDRLFNLAAENKKLKRTNIILTIFLILVFISQYIEHWSDIFR
jgi:hypothetical protein